MSMTRTQGRKLSAALAIAILPFSFLAAESSPQVDVLIAQAESSVQVKKDVPVTQVAPAPQPPAVLIANVSKAIDDYRASAGETTWATVVTFLQSLLNDPQATQLDLAKLQGLVPQLSQLGLKVFDGGQARIWTFPQIAQSREIIVEWREVKTAPKAGAHTQVISIPDVLIAEAKVINVPSRGEAQPLAKAPAGKVTKVAASKPVSVQAKVPQSKFLVLTGNDKTTRTVWWSSYKLTPSGFVAAGDLLSNVPASLMNNVQGKVSLSGTDFVVTVTPSISQTTSYGKPDSSAYRLVFHLNGGKYVLEGRAVDESIHSVIFQFLRAEREGKMELAKTWVADPKLASIPKYVGLSARPADGQMRLVAMPNPMNGCQRFRLITFGRDDLIFDVGRANDPKSKQIMWIIKAIFVAPADPALQKFARNLPGFDSSVFARVNAEDEVADVPDNAAQLDETAPAKKSVAATRVLTK